MQDNGTQVMPKAIQLTQEGLDELKQELKELTDVRLPAVIDRVAKARDYGDLSENAEYHSAKEDQTLVETRIDEIQNILAHAHIVKHTTSSSKVGMGSKVVVTVTGKKSKKLTFTIVGETEAKPTEGKISSVSPIGTALMNKKKGDTAKVSAPAGEVEYVIEDIK
jgi:transcription elongation factor GreA